MVLRDLSGEKNTASNDKLLDLLMNEKHTKERIIEKAVDLFYEYGYAKASMRGLAKNLGMSNSSIYNHFTNKEEILFTIIERAGGTLLSKLQEITERNHEPIECLKEMIFSQVCLFKTKGKELSIFVDELYQLPDQLRDACNKQHRRIFDLYRNKLREIEDTHVTNMIDKTVTTFGIIGIMNWVYHWAKENGSLSTEEIAIQIINLLFYGILRTDDL